MPETDDVDTGLSIIVPCYNEGRQVEVAHDAIVRAFGDVPRLEILFIDDGSTDDTFEHMRKLAAVDDRVRYLSFTRNFGQAAAITAGFRYASRPWLLQLDADLQFPPEEAWILLEQAGKGYDVVFGIRRRRRDPLIRRVGAVCHQWVAARLLGIELPRGISSFRVLRTPVARTLAELRMSNSYYAARVPLVTSRYKVVTTAHEGRRSGRSHYDFMKLAGHAFELFFGFSWRPLNAVHVLAALGVASAAVVAVAALTGTATVMGVALAGLGVAALTLASVALSARYLHRLLLDNGPLRPYYIAEANLTVSPEDTIDGGARPVPPPRPLSGSTRTPRDPR
jgi:glycosyltransferase involved in cell wall biosynthesis